ncbi:hypothetical protein EI94DRAFT_1192767 [Lactarius quietus]|nr:hypothetical protein EI94DRAFT_1192767 [Lactarius quietus]
MPTVPTAPPVGASPATQASTGIIRKEFVCLLCGHRSVRRSNLRSHTETQNPNRKRPFVCPESDCRRPFTHKHDLKCHLMAMHGTRRSDNSSVSQEVIRMCYSLVRQMRNRAAFGDRDYDYDDIEGGLNIQENV